MGSFRPSAPGTFNIRAYVKDSTGKAVCKSLSVKAISGEELTNLCSVNAAQVSVGNPVIVTGAAKGGSDPYKFVFQYKRSTDSEWINFGSGSKGTFTPSAPGTFNIRAYVKDSTGKTICKSLGVKVVSGTGLTNKSTTTSAVALGNPVVVNGAASGGTAPYTFTYQYKRSYASEWTTFGSGASASFKPSAPGTFNIRAYVKDSTGTAVCKSMTVTVS